MPGTGWSTAHGDLRIPHFVGLHALQVLPFIAWVLRRRRLPADAQTRLIVTAAGSYFALFAILLDQALRGQPVLHPDAQGMGALGAWALASLFCAWWAVASGLTIAIPEMI